MLKSIFIFRILTPTHYLLPYFSIFQGSKEVLYSGDVHSAKEEVNGLIRSMGFVPVDRGSLRNARDIEDIPVQRFPLWKRPLIVSLILFFIFFMLAFTKFQICWTWSWDAGKVHIHSSQFQSLCSTKSFREMLQNLPYFWGMRKLKYVVFC